MSLLVDCSHHKSLLITYYITNPRYRGRIFQFTIKKLLVQLYTKCKLKIITESKPEQLKGILKWNFIFLCNL